MSELKNRIDFVAAIVANNCNPNGDPAAENMPRIDMRNIGEISAVCIKHKLRKALLAAGQSIFVQSEDEYESLAERAKGELGDVPASEYIEKAVEKYYDVRGFGQVFAFSGRSGRVSGCVSVSPAFTIAPVIVERIGTTRSIMAEKPADTMGGAYRIRHGLYVFSGSISVDRANRNGFSAEDAEALKQAILNMFEDDFSTARPAGSISLAKLFWVEHDSKMGQCPVVDIIKAVDFTPKNDDPKWIDDYDVTFTPPVDKNGVVIEGITVTEY